MIRILFIISTLIIAAACEKSTVKEQPVPALSLERTPLSSVMLGGPVCRNVPDEECLAREREAFEFYNRCISACRIEGPCIDADLGCLPCESRCEPRPLPFNCGKISIKAECSACADDIIESVKTCVIPNIVSPFKPPKIRTIVPCEQQGWEEIGDGCGPCRPQTNEDTVVFVDDEGLKIARIGQIGRTHCTCPDPEGASWSSICRVPYQMPKVVSD